jgi:hypothetical protein
VLSRQVSIRFDATGKEDLTAGATTNTPCVSTSVNGEQVHFDVTGADVLCQIDKLIC